MKTIKKYLIVAVLVLLGGVAAYFLVKNLKPFEQQKPAVGEFAPALSLADLNGGMVRLSDFRGKVVLLNFWASWCPPCKDEMPGFQKVFLEFQDEGFTVVAVAVNDITPTVVSLVKDLGLRFPVVAANKRATGDYANISQIPASFLIGKNGKIIRKVKGVYSEDELRSDVKQALKETIM